MTQRFNFHWRYQPNAQSRDVQLLSYLQGKNDTSIIPLREKILQAIRAFWLPFAYIDEPEGKRLALEAVYALEKHADYLRSQFDLEPSFYARGGHETVEMSYGASLQRATPVNPLQQEPKHDVQLREEGFEEVFG